MLYYANKKETVNVNNNHDNNKSRKVSAFGIKKVTNTSLWCEWKNSQFISGSIKNLPDNERSAI